MTRFIKVMPLLALMLGLTVFLGNAAVEKHNKLASEEWMFTGSNLTNPEHYTQAIPSRQNDCVEADESVCVVLAPADASDSRIPDFDQALKDALAGDLDDDRIIKGPYNP